MRPPFSHNAINSLYIYLVNETLRESKTLTLNRLRCANVDDVRMIVTVYIQIMNIFTVFTDLLQPQIQIFMHLSLFHF